jgi:hypothetical protein
MHSARAALVLNRPAEEVQQVLLDAGDDGYFLVASDAASVAAAEAVLSARSTPLARMQAWETLWQAVFDGVFAASHYITLAVAHLGAERDPSILQNVLQHAQLVLDRLLQPSQADAMGATLDALLLERAHKARSARKRLWQAQLVVLGRTQPALDAIEAILKTAADATPLRLQAAVALVLRGRYTEAQARRTVGRLGDSARAASLQIAAACARPERKQHVFARLLADSSLPDETLLMAAAILFHPAHARVTQPLLVPALRALPQLTRRRKIFFVNRWIAAVIGGQHDAAALAVVRRYMASDLLEAPVWRKCAEAAWELEQVVAIRRGNKAPADTSLRAVSDRPFSARPRSPRLRRTARWSAG